MWSTNASPVATLTRPRPSSATVAFSWVSLLLRMSSPPLFKAHLYSVGVRAQSFHRGEAQASVAKHLEIASVEAQHAAVLEEAVDTEGRSETRRSERRERVIGARRVVAQRHCRISPDEDRARILDLRGQPSRVLSHDQQVLGRKVVGEVDRLLHVLGHDQTACGGVDDLGPFQASDQAAQLFFDAVCEGWRVRD